MRNSDRVEAKLLVETGPQRAGRDYRGAARRRRVRQDDPRASAFATTYDVQEAFDDGILWVTPARDAENLLGSIRDLIQQLSGARPDFATVNDASSAAVARRSSRSAICCSSSTMCGRARTSSLSCKGASAARG